MLTSLLSVLLLAAAMERPFVVEVVDRQTGRGVPLVELETVNALRFYTDSAGVVAIREPSLMGRKVFFSVASHGYQLRPDGFGYHGKALDVKPDGHARVELERTNVAERLYRVTGEGIYAESLAAGRPVPLAEPLGSGLVVGCDSTQAVPYRGRLYWFWGDTSRMAYPLGNFKASGATSLLPARGGLDPALGVDLNYFVDSSGFAKAMAPLESRGPVWLSGLVVLGKGADEAMYAHYAKIAAGGDMKTYERGLVMFDHLSSQFRPVAVYCQRGAFPHGAHAYLAEAEQEPYVYYCMPFPLVRVKASAEHLARLEDYEAFTCLVAGSRLAERKLDRAADGRLRWDWKAATEAVGPVDLAELVGQKKLTHSEARFLFRDPASGKTVVAHRGGIAWSGYRKRWVMIFCQWLGTSALGEIWYSEAEAPLGPWSDPVKIISHDRYSFYNPKLHPYFSGPANRWLYFEGTYTKTFSGNLVATPRYDYNQIMYRIDLADRRLTAPPPQKP